MAARPRLQTPDKRLSVAEACRRLEQAAGTQFDPRVVETYLRLLREAEAGRAA